MKKIILIACLFAGLLGLDSQAQTVRLIDNTFVSLGGGLSLYSNDHITSQDHLWGLPLGFPSIDASFGKWVLNSVACRIGFSSFVADNEYSVPGGLVIGSKVYPFTGGIGDSNGIASSMFYSGHVDLFWDIRSSFSTLRTDRSFNIYPFIGLGFVMRNRNLYTNSRDSDFIAIAGVNMDFLIHDDFRLFLEGKYIMFPQDYDNNVKLSGVCDLTLGLKYDIHRLPYRRRNNGESLNSYDDWYMAIGAGANYGFGADFGAPAVLGEITVGKYFTTCASARFQANGGLVSIGDDMDTYADIHGDLLLDVLNFVDQHLSRKNKNAVLGRGFSPLLYAGAGIYDRFGSGKIKVGVDAGCMFRFFLSRSADLYIDARYAMVPHLLNPNSSAIAEGIPSLTFGYIHNFGMNTCR